MLYYFTEISKYMIIAVMLLYVLMCVLYELTGENYRACGTIVFFQRVSLIVIQLLSYATLCLKLGELDFLFLMFFLQVVLFGCMTVSSLLYPRLDKVLLNNMCLMLSIGFIVLSRLNFNKALKQFGIVIISLAIGVFIPKILSRLKGLSRMGYIYAIVGLVPLAIVLVMGAATNGSKLSYSIGGITIQPSELVKIIFVFCIAALLSRAKNWGHIIIATGIAAAHVGILVLSKDLGSGLIFFVAYLFMLFIATRSYLLFGMGVAAGAGASVVAYKMFRHVQVRVQAYKDPFSVIERQGYQISQSLFAIGCGSFYGMGLSKGAPNDIPFVESDFIFSAVSEEMGAIFAVCMLLVALSSFVIMLRTSMVCGKKFYRLLASGFGVLYIFQVFLTVGGGIKFIPLTGVTLPFVSYGGSSVLSSVIVFYVVQWVISRYRDEEYEEELARYEDKYEDEYYEDEYDEEYEDEYDEDGEYYEDEYYEDDEYYEEDEYYEDGDYVEDYYEDDRYDRRARRGRR